MSASPPVLVVVVNNGRDWERVVVEGWYRIPLKRAPHPVAADYLAFYFTRGVGQQPWQVAYYAPILRYHIVRRRDLLPMEATHQRADEWYYRIDLATVQQLERPISSRKLRRIAFIPTTLEQLVTATDVVDLWRHDESEEVLWSYFTDTARKTTQRLPFEA